MDKPAALVDKPMVPTDEQDIGPGLKYLMERYVALHREIWYQVDELNALADEIKKRVRELGYTVGHGGLTAEWRAGSKRVTWDSKALDGFAAAHPEILPFRKESETQAAVSLKVKEHEQAE